jgi:hypothetical protein
MEELPINPPDQIFDEEFYEVLHQKKADAVFTLRSMIENNEITANDYQKYFTFVEKTTNIDMLSDFIFEGDINLIN